MDEKDIQLTGDLAERLDALFGRVEKTLPRCPKHPTMVVYLDGGCTACRMEANRRNETERIWRRRRCQGGKR